MKTSMYARTAALILALTTLPGHSAEIDYKSLLWVDLLPLEDFVALLNPPPVMHIFGAEGPATQVLRRDGTSGFASPGNHPYEQALVSTKVKPELDGATVGLPGFVVPIEYDDEQRVTEFFLVPFFGACIHTPPPPPNQIVYVSYPAGLELPSIFDPFYVEGRLTASITDNDTALSAYRIDAARITLYEPEEEAGD